MNVQRSITFDLTIAIGTDDEREFCHGFPGVWKLVAAYMMPATALAVHAANYIDQEVVKGAGGTAIATTSTNSGGANVALVKGTAVTFTISGTGTDLEFGPTDCIELTKTEAGTPAADLDGSYTFVFEHVSQTS